MCRLCVQLLLEHVDIVAPDQYDPLHELLDDLGEVPDVDFLIGNSHILCHMLSISLSVVQCPLQLLLLP